VDAVNEVRVLRKIIPILERQYGYHRTRVAFDQWAWLRLFAGSAADGLACLLICPESAASKQEQDGHQREFGSAHPLFTAIAMKPGDHYYGRKAREQRESHDTR
jgi:hypothetical protein